MSQALRVNTVTDHGCFGCGERNPIGLRLAFYRDGERRIRSGFTPRIEHEGYAGLTHGGIVATLLDEAMSWAVTALGWMAVTTRMELRYRRPVPVGAPVTVIGEVTRDGRRIVETRGEIRDADGNLLVEASGAFARVSTEQQRNWEDLYIGGRGDACSVAQVGEDRSVQRDRRPVFEDEA